MTQQHWSRFHCHADLLKVTHFCCQSEQTCILKWHLVSVPTGSVGSHPPLPNSPFSSVRDLVSLPLLDWASFLAFLSCFYDCWSGDAGLVFSHSAVHLHLCLVEVGFFFVQQLWWMTSLSHMVDWSALHPRMHLSLSDLHCLMITSPVCLCLKASRQILICFANLLSLSWLLYLLFYVLTLC